jgi:hypothetical protein
MEKQQIQKKIRYSSISYARDHGIISKEEAEFLLEEYMKEFERKVQSRSEKRLFSLQKVRTNKRVKFILLVKGIV